MSAIKTFTLGLVSILFFSFFTYAPNSEVEKTTTTLATKTITVYYFHNTRRCATCTAIEKVSLGALNTHFADRIKAGSVVFQSLDIEKDAGKKLASKLGITEQTLIVTNGTKRLDLTTQAFMYARTKPEKLENLIKAAVNSLSK